ncbi:alpha/beta fold hydrolase [Halorubrum sp. BOL3-1]|uniref:alpha/beta fold hydrolase n=1 Tax=Halorubrum sp. BOL3-1 TaxID=2497325 RepID=UPI001F4FBFAA|nr:alpha/beta hydrolase [Halorubrum sp. BOL3-1]
MAHGLYDNGRRWVSLADELTDEYGVVAYDARGHGRSDAPESGYAIDDRVADLCGLLDALDIADPILFGHSIGAATVAWTAARHPSLPRGIVLVDPVGVDGTPEIDPERRAEIVRQRLAEGKELSIEERIRDQYDGLGDEHARRLAVATDECDPAIANISRHGQPPLAGAFEEITAPTLVLRRDSDIEQRVTDIDAVETLRSGRIVHVPDAGHYVFRDEFDAAVAELRTFLERI